MHFVKFHPEVASCLLSRGKNKYAPLKMRLLWKYIGNYFLVHQLISHFLSYLQNYKEFKAKILDLQREKYGLSFDVKKCTTCDWALGDENVIGVRAFKSCMMSLMIEAEWNQQLIYQSNSLFSPFLFTETYGKPVLMSTGPMLDLIRYQACGWMGSCKNNDLEGRYSSWVLVSEESVWEYL